VSKNAPANNRIPQAVRRGIQDQRTSHKSWVGGGMEKSMQIIVSSVSIS